MNINTLEKKKISSLEEGTSLADAHTRNASLSFPRPDTL